MAGLTLAAADAALKEYYLPGIREQLNNDIPMVNFFQTNSEDVEGREAFLAIHIQRNSGVGSRLESDTLPTAGNQAYVNPKIPLRYHYTAIQLSGPVMKGMKTDRGSFTRALKSEMDGAAHDLKRDYNRQIWGTADGIIAQCALSSNTTVINLTTHSVVQMAQFEVGMLVDLGTSADPVVLAANGTGQKITAVGTTTITVTTAMTTATTTYVYRSGNGGQTTTQRELTGLQAIVATGGISGASTAFGVNPTTYPVWQSYVSTSVGALSENLMAKAQQTINRTSGKYPNMIVTDDATYRSFAGLLTSLKRFNDTTNLKGGYNALTFQGGGPDTPVVWDRDCPSGQMYFLNSDHLTQFMSADWSWMDDDGAVLARLVGSPGTDAYQATLYKYSEIACDQRNVHGVMTGVTGS